MKVLKQFRIAFVGLSNKTHRFNFKIDRTFFQCFEKAPIDHCDINVDVDFEKKESFFHLRYFIDGTVTVACDRCLEPFDQNIFGDYEMFVKFNEQANPDLDEEDEVIFISKTDDYVDLSKSIYDFCLLSLPLNCIHPKDENGEETCNPEMLSKLHQEEEDIQEDPRWEALKQLKLKKDQNGTS